MAHVEPLVQDPPPEVNDSIEASVMLQPKQHKDPNEDDDNTHNNTNAGSPTLPASPLGSWRSKRAMTQAPQQTSSAASPNLAEFALRLNRAPTATSQDGLAALSPSQASPSSRVDPVHDPPQHVLSRFLTINEEVRLYNAAPSKRPDMVAIWRYKMTLVGAGEAGKTSLRKCFASTPLFFKSLPEVGTTTGIDIQRHRTKVSGDSVIDVEVHDFAGQEVYHSHSLFLTNRTLFIFVWNMAGVEQTFDDYGISSEEEARLKQWADVVQAKCPGAPMVVVGTHKDELRDDSVKTVVLILNKVCKLISDYIETFRPSANVKNIFVGGSFCVSCRNRTVTPENQGGPTKIKELFQWLAELCGKYAKTDSLYPQGAVPRYVVTLIATLERLKADMETVLLPMKTYNQLSKQIGIPKELLHKVTTMLHDWGVLYLFDRQASKLGRQDCIFLHPEWLSKMVAVVFTYAHACTAPAYERATMEVPLIDLNFCDLIEPTKLILEGVLSSTLARVLFTRILRLLKREQTDQNVDICFSMLANMDLIYKNTYIPEVGPYTNAKTPASNAVQYYVPSIFPRTCPRDLPVHISRLMRNKGVHLFFNICPFPKEFMYMLHCRCHPLLMRLQVNAPCPDADPPTRKVQNNWRDAMWLAAGGGEGQDVGLGPLRAFLTCDLEGRRIDVWSFSPSEGDPRIMTARELCRQVADCVRDLSFKYPGISLSEEDVRDKPTDTLEDETFMVLTSALKPTEVEFLLSALGFQPTQSQEATLQEITRACSGEDVSASSTSVAHLKVSLLLDKLVKACMLQDPSIVSFSHYAQRRQSRNEAEAE